MFFRYGLQPLTTGILLLASSILEIHSEKSLFDELPLNGALDPSTSSYSSTKPNHKPVKAYSTPTIQSRSHYQKPGTTPTSSLFDNLPDQGALSPTGNKVRNPRDSVDFDVTRLSPSSEFDVASTWDSSFLSPIVNFITRPAARGPPPPRIQTHRGRPYPPPGIRNNYGPPPSRTHSYSYFNHNNQPPRLSTRQEIPNGQNKSVNLVSANSGGPTVIVYAHPNKAGQSGYTDQPSRHPIEQDRTEPKNEVHYHYHMNENKNEEGKPASGGYPGEGYKSEPPRYGHPIIPQRENPKVSQAYGPPTIRPGPYPEARYNLLENDESNSFSNSNSLSDLNDHLKEEDDFSRRTFVTPSRPSKGYRPPSTVTLTRPSRPSTSYEIPPSFNAPSSSYNNPSNEYGPPAPETSYGPPTSPPAPPPPSSDQAGGDQYETTITLQTIPITRQVTELVQVPNVVHKISSSRPSVSDQAIQDEPINPPSSIYGPPAPPPRKNIPQSSRDSTRGSDRPFDSHLAQILGVGPTQNPKDAVLQELLLGQARNPGLDLSLSDLEVFSLLQGSRGQSTSGSRTPILTPGRNIFGGLFGGSGSSRLSGSNSLSSALFQPREQGLSSDGLGSLREAFREQRFQLALADLRKQLREQNRDNVRERSSYSSLFTKGALLLSALTLLPSFVNPMASAAGVTAASSAIPNFMLPVTAAGMAGRRKRSIQRVEGIQLSKTAFEKCLENASNISDSIAYEKWSACAKNLITSFPYDTKIKNPTQTSPSPPRSTFSYVIWNGVLLPKLIRSDLKKYISQKNLAKASQCIQRDFCKNIQEMDKLPKKNALRLAYYYSVITRTVDKNRWIEESLIAAENNKCEDFVCKRNF